MILSYFWNNKKSIDIEEILQVNSETSSEDLTRLIQLLEATLIMAQSQKLKRGKNKLREMFLIDILTQSFSKLYPLFLSL